MKKPWSITTTLRNPERLRSFLIVLKQIGSSEWNLENQKKYQILLIQNRLYGYGNQQFYDGLSHDQIKLVDNLSEKIISLRDKQLDKTQQQNEIFHAYEKNKEYVKFAKKRMDSLLPTLPLTNEIVDPQKI